MANLKISPEIQKSVLKRRSIDPTVTRHALAKEFHIHRDTVERILALDEPVSVETSAPEKSVITETGWEISLPKTDIHTLDQLIEYANVDLSIWSVEKFIVNKWAVGAKNASGEVVVTPLYQVKAFLKKKQNIIDAKSEIEDLKEMARSTITAPAPIHAKVAGDNMLEISIPDLHAGKLSWGKETLGKNYDTKIAVQTFWKAFNDLMSKAAVHDFSEIWYVVGNDLLNADDVAGRTTAGTPVSNDGRYQKTFSAVRSLNIEAIERLRKIAPVRVIICGGNHDRLSCWHLGDSLQMFYHDSQDVKIDNSPAPRKYHQFGNTMLMFTHGDQGKRDDYPLLMAAEQRKMFGETLYHEAHTGHIHKVQLNEQHGVRVRILPALCPPDAWHANMGFTMNVPSAEAYCWNKKTGLFATYHYNDDV